MGFWSCQVVQVFCNEHWTWRWVLHWGLHILTGLFFTKFPVFNYNGGGTRVTIKNWPTNIFFVGPQLLVRTWTALSSPQSIMVQKLHISYNQIHESLRSAVIRHRINEEFQPDIMIAIGGGGFIPARILRTFLEKRNNKNIPIQVWAFGYLIL